MKECKVLFNEKCSICNFEVRYYKKRSNLNFIDCSSMEDKYLKKLHVVFEDGSEISGVDAFILVWKNTKGYEWLAKIVQAKGIYHLAKTAYFFLAYLLFWRYKYFVK